MAQTQRQQGVKAGILIRFLASCYDIVILLGVAMLLVGLPITLSKELFGATPPQWVQYLLFSCVSYAYFVGFWVKGGSTTGMRPWKLRVAMSETGDPITLLAASVRYTVLMITWLALGMTLVYMMYRDTNHFLFFLAAGIPALSLIVMAISSARLPLHDIISGTGIFRIKG